MTASDRARASKTSCLDTGDDTHAECPMDVAIFPSAVMAYFRTEKGRPVTALCSSACAQQYHHFIPHLCGTLKCPNYMRARQHCSHSASARACPSAAMSYSKGKAIDTNTVQARSFGMAMLKGDLIDLQAGTQALLEAVRIRRGSGVLQDVNCDTAAPERAHSLAPEVRQWVSDS